MNRKDDGLININACGLLIVQQQFSAFPLSISFQEQTPAPPSWTAGGSADSELSRADSKMVQVLVTVGQCGSAEPVLPLSLLVD